MLEKLGKNLLDRLGLQIKQQHPQHEVQSFSQAELRQAIITRAGHKFFLGLDHPTQQKVSEIFAGQDVDGLNQLIKKYDAPTVEAISLALDASVKTIIGEGEVPSYHAWMTNILQGREEQLQR